MLSWLLKQLLIFFNNQESIVYTPGVFLSTLLLAVKQSVHSEVYISKLSSLYCM